MKIISVIVTYFPNPEHLVDLCQTLFDSNSSVILVDNSEEFILPANLAVMPHCIIIKLHENMGIAKAQNVGIKLALESGADIIVFFDQDSKPTPQFIPSLLVGLNNDAPCVVAPVCLDDVTGVELPSFRINGFGFPEKVFSDQSSAPIPVDLVISSGSAATASTFKAAGMMDESLFIDYVDFEWCFRCREKGIPIRVLPQATMRHSIGQKSIKFGFMGGSVHSAHRSYYKVRNCFLLFRKPTISWKYAARETGVMLIHFILSLPYVSDKHAYVKILFKGISHGLQGLTGKQG